MGRAIAHRRSQAISVRRPKSCPDVARIIASGAARSEGASFNAMLEQYIKAPEITRTRLYLETMGDVLSATGEKIIIDDSMRNLLPILPLTGKPLEKK